MKETNVTIISTNLNKGLIKKYTDYYLIEDNFTLEELSKNKKVIFFNVLNNLTKYELDKIFKYLKDNNIKYVNLTNNLELTLYSDYLIVCDKDNILAEGNTIEILKNDKLLKRLGFELPFIIDLSLLLQDYGLINHIYYDKESLVNDLWK